MFRFVDLHRERPHPHGSAGKGASIYEGWARHLASKRSRQAQVSASFDRDFSHRFIGVCRDNREVRIHCPKFGFF